MVYVIFWCFTQAKLGVTDCRPKDPPGYSTVLGFIPGRAYRTPDQCLDVLKKWQQIWHVQIEHGRLPSGWSGTKVTEWYQCIPEPEGQFEP